MISYEIAMGMSVVTLFLIVGDLNLSKVIQWQADHGWLVLYQPVSFVIFLVAAFAETNRLPFDLPESETELVGGYHTEYSSMKFALFFLGEYANMIASSAMMVTLFFGGWSLPFLGTPATGLLGGLVHIGVFLAKMIVLMVVFIWVRWMLPRFRYDQLMDLGWKFLIPLALGWFLILTALKVADDQGWNPVVAAAGAVAVVVLGAVLLRSSIRAASGAELDDVTADVVGGES